ncbi:hypothetical protein JD969_09380 [Planctomycetota bacterium]|nr:hypothetical protein JD969_09380 [Planctomycetota bacterium]
MRLRTSDQRWVFVCGFGCDGFDHQKWLVSTMRDVLELLVMGGFMIMLLGAVHAWQLRRRLAAKGIVQCPRCGEQMGKSLVEEKRRCRECGCRLQTSGG